jgi:hypothetical protein
MGLGSGIFNIGSGEAGLIRGFLGFSLFVSTAAGTEREKDSALGLFPSLEACDSFVKSRISPVFNFSLFGG